MVTKNFTIAAVTNSSGSSIDILKKAAIKQSVVFDIIKFPILALSDFDTSDLIKTLLKYDVVYYRTGMRGTTLSELTRILLAHNIPIINGNHVCSEIHRKSVQALHCARHKINHPKTYLLRKPDYELASSLLGQTFVIKPDIGSKGNGVAMISSPEALASIANNSTNTNRFLYQELLTNASEYRVYTLGTDCVVSYKKNSGSEDFRSNLHTGGSMLKTEPERIKTLYSFASMIAKVFDTDIAGIDIMFKNDECYLLEINTQPGWKNLHSLTGVNLSELTIIYIIEKARLHYSKA